MSCRLNLTFTYRLIRIFLNNGLVFIFILGDFLIICDFLRLVVRFSVFSMAFMQFTTLILLLYWLISARRSIGSRCIVIFLLFFNNLRPRILCVVGIVFCKFSNELICTKAEIRLKGFVNTDFWVHYSQELILVQFAPEVLV